MDQQTSRKGAFKNFYRQEEDLTPECYDSVKIAADALKAKRKNVPFVDLKS